MNVPDLQSTLVRASLRGDILSIVIGVLVCAVAMGGLTLYRFRRRAKDPALLWFGVFALLYAVRLLARTDVVPFLADPLPRMVWRYAVAAITYAIPIPVLLFVREMFPGWRRVLRWSLLLVGLFAVAGWVSDAVLRQPESLHTVNNFIVLCFWTAFVVAIFRDRQPFVGKRAVRVGLVVFALTILLGNLSSLGILPLPFDPEPLGFVAFLAGLGRLIAGRLMHNEERLVTLDKELEIARKIQMTILPRENPRSERLRIATRYLPMTAVAGDLYDFLILDENRVGILIADVSGHGVPAALIASMVKIAIAGQLGHADRPDEVLAGMNRTLAGKLKGQFVTAAYVFLDLERGRLRYAAAGHPPLLWRHGARRTAEELSQKGLVLGARPKTAYEPVEIPIEGGDRLVLYTDGLLEARNAEGEQFGNERLLGLVSSSAGEDVEKAAGSVIGGLAAWTGGRAQEDDFTLVVVDVLT